MLKQKLIIIISIILQLHSFAYSENTGEILDKVFLPSSKDEIQEVYEKFPKNYSCQEFNIMKNIYEDEEIIAYKIKYLSDNLWITGILAQPNKEGEFPLLILNHGGTSGLTKIDKDRIFEFAEKGYIVLASTYRGEKGLAGESEGKVGFLKEEVNDVLNLLECGKKFENVKKDKIGMLGGSHGGGITLLAIERTRDLSCAVVWSGPADMFNENTRKMLEEGIKDPKKLKMYLSFFLSEGIEKINELFEKISQGKPTINDARYELLSRSSLYFVEYIGCPLLFFYGEKDPLVSVEDAKNLVNELQKYNKVFEYKIYPDSGHNILGEDRRSAEKIQEEFFKKYLRSE